MRQPTFAPALAACLVSALLLTSACDAFRQKDTAPEPYFKPGEYGGDPLPGTEHLYNVRLSPDGQKVAFIRSFTPGAPMDPRDQLWITNRDGSDPQIIGVNVGTIDWSPDGEKLAVTVWYGIDAYVYTINLKMLTATQWTGRDTDFFNHPTVSNPIWFQDGERLLVSVMAKDYQQPFERGLYTINTRTGEIVGPLVELMQAAFLGEGDLYATGRKYVMNKDPRDGNSARFDFETRQWKWLTELAYDSLKYVEVAVPSPTKPMLAQARVVSNAWQLFLMDSDGNSIGQVTHFGAENPRWTYDGRYVLFKRDVHKGAGARYVPFIYDVESGSESVLFALQPDSLPQFPALSEPSSAAFGLAP